MKKLAVVKELLTYLWQQKMWWLTPFVLILFIFGLFILFAGGSGLAPFIYPLF